MVDKIIAQGAEAILIHKNDNLIKRRVKKGYRHPELDEKIRTRRTRREGKILSKINKTINSPEVFEYNDKKGEIVMEFIEGKRLSDHLDTFPIKKSLKICFDIGSEVGLLHSMDIMHGDLTTSNMILKGDKINLIDFGLGFHSPRIENKAVDLRLLHQALKSRHFKHCEEYFKEVLRGYKVTSKEDEKVLKQLKIVQSRGRYKTKTKKQPNIV
ncbi:KEOPS complex kinase/ATPase Bud32 [Nanoarchaeota archaeon]